MSDPARQGTKTAGWVLILGAWLLALGFTTILIVIRAPHPQKIDWLMPYLILPVWFLCLVLLAVGTHRLTRFIKNRTVHVLVTVTAVLLQCYGYCLFVIVTAVDIHLWAGGNV